MYPTLMYSISDMGMDPNSQYYYIMNDGDQHCIKIVNPIFHVDDNSSDFYDTSVPFPSIPDITSGYGPVRKKKRKSNPITTLGFDRKSRTRRKSPRKSRTRRKSPRKSRTRRK